MFTCHVNTYLHIRHCLDSAENFTKKRNSEVDEKYTECVHGDGEVFVCVFSTGELSQSELHQRSQRLEGGEESLDCDWLQRGRGGGKVQVQAVRITTDVFVFSPKALWEV